jgi:hypothetical protein
VTNDAPITTLLESTAQGEYSLPIRLPPLGFAVFRCTKDLNRLKSQEVRKKESKPAPKKKTAKKKAKA